MPSKGTTPTQIRLTEEDKVRIKVIQERFGIPSVAGAIRFAIQYLLGSHPGILPEAKPEPKKPAKRK